MDNQQVRHTVYIAYSLDGLAYIGFKSWLDWQEFEAYTTASRNADFVYAYKEAIKTFDNAKDAWLLEQKLIDTLGALNNKLFANMAKTPFAGILRGSHRTEEHKLNISQGVKLAMANQALKGHPRQGAKLSEEQKAKSIATRKERDNGSYWAKDHKLTWLKRSIARYEKCINERIKYMGSMQATDEDLAKYALKLKQLYVNFNDQCEST